MFRAIVNISYQHMAATVTAYPSQTVSHCCDKAQAMMPCTCNTCMSLMQALGKDLKLT